MPRAAPTVASLPVSVAAADAAHVSPDTRADALLFALDDTAPVAVSSYLHNTGLLFLVRGWGSAPPPARKNARPSPPPAQKLTVPDRETGCPKAKQPRLFSMLTDR